MMFNFAVKEFDSVARMRDLDIARALGFDQPRDIRKLLGRYMETLEGFGDVVRRSYKPTDANGDADLGGDSRHGGANPPAVAGAPGVEYWLNKKQALFICTKSDAPNAIDVTVQIIEVFVAWQEGRLTPHPSTGQPAPWELIDITSPAMVEWRATLREMRLVFGAASVREAWLSSPFGILMAERQAPEFAGITPDATADAARFIAAMYDVTGNASDKITAADLALAYGAWRRDNDLPEMLAQSMYLQLKATSMRYRDAVTGKSFHSHKSSTKVYRGLRLRRAVAVGE